MLNIMIININILLKLLKCWSRK